MTRQSNAFTEIEPDEQPPVRWGVHVALGVVAFLAMTFAGYYMSDANPWEAAELLDVGNLLSALSYSVPTMAILFAHEMGHYLHCRKFDIDATPPYFLPGLPLPGLGVIPFIGTFGAFIRMRLEPLEGEHLLKVGAWGPLAGFIVAVPVLFTGFALSDVRPLPEDPAAAVQLGDSLLLILGELVFHPDIPEGHDVYLHPLAMAGWVGCLLTALNLMPIGQLDGGHIAYAIFGDGFNRVAPVTAAVMVALGIFAFPGWLVLAGLVGIIGIRHPDIARDGPVRGKPMWLGIASLLMFVLTFSPAPIDMGSLFEMIGLW